MAKRNKGASIICILSFSHGIVCLRDTRTQLENGYDLEIFWNGKQFLLNMCNQTCYSSDTPVINHELERLPQTEHIRGHLWYRETPNVTLQSATSTYNNDLSYLIIAY
jgi:hypothetical protein